MKHSIPKRLLLIFLLPLLLVGCDDQPKKEPLKDDVKEEEFDCAGRGELEIADKTLPEAVVGKPYLHELLIDEAFICHSASVPSHQLGIAFTDSTDGLFITGVPHTTGTIAFEITIGECGTQCRGRDASFTVSLTIADSLNQ